MILTSASPKVAERFLDRLDTPNGGYFKAVVIDDRLVSIEVYSASDVLLFVVRAAPFTSLETLTPTHGE